MSQTQDTVAPRPSDWRRTTVSALLVVVPGLLFCLIALLVSTHHAIPGDVRLLQVIHRHASPGLDTLAVAMTSSGSIFAILALTAVIAALYTYWRQRTEVLFLIACVGATGAANVILKQIFQKARPELWPRIVRETDYSFPSGHSMATSALAAALIVLLWNTRYRLWAVAIGVIYVVAVGASRLYLGVHYPSDVLGGWCASIVIVWAIYFAWYRRKSGAQQTSQDSSDSKKP